MKTSRFTFFLFASLLALVLVAGFLVGGIYASARAVRADQQASLIYFSAIHDALERQDYARAATLTNTAVDSHVGVLSTSARSPWALRTFYTLPWTQGQESALTGSSLPAVRRSYAAQPEQLRSETRSFLATQR